MKVKLFLLIVFLFFAALSVYINNLIYLNKQKHTYPIEENYDFLNIDITPEATASPTPAATPTPSPLPVPTYDSSQIFYDDFAGEHIKGYYWNKLDREKNYNNELQSYEKSQVYVCDGNLVLTADKLNEEYISGLVNTQKKIEFQYGLIEVNMKYPKGKSFFPAIWMLPVNNERYPEVDIMEVLGHNPNVVFFVYHFYDTLKHTDYTYKWIEEYDIFHTYSLLWTPESLTWYVDNHQVFETTEQVPHEPMYLIINFAIGGDWPGNPNENTMFPSSVLVDYVKITPYELIDKETLNDFN